MRDVEKKYQNCYANYSNTLQSPLLRPQLTMPASMKAKEKYAMAIDSAWQHHDAREHNAE